MGLKGYIWALITVVAALIALLATCILLLLAAYVEHHQ